MVVVRHKHSHNCTYSNYSFDPAAPVTSDRLDTILTKVKGTTANAIRQRVAKIKNQAKAVIEGIDVDITFGGSTTGKAKGTPKKPSAGGKNASADDDEEESVAPTPTPKKRAANGKAKGTPRAKKVKDEKDEKGEEGAEKGSEEGGESPVRCVKSEQSGEV